MADRNFDDLAQRFAARVYGGLKGEIRLAVLWRDIDQFICNRNCSKPLRVLDIGAGLGQIAIQLAQQGHQIDYNDISQQMMAIARAAAASAGVEQQIGWHHGPYQQVLENLEGKYDLILCHALLEWLSEPQQLIARLTPLMRQDSGLSLCFYNPAAKEYRNLIRGNFDWLAQQDSYQSDSGSLTPNHPSSMRDVRQWLAEQGLSVHSDSGIRVFHDYVVEKRGGHQSDEAVLAMELAYSQREPFKSLGRYIHWMCCLDKNLA